MTHICRFLPYKTQSTGPGVSGVKPITYAARFLYWAIRHRSLTAARWVMQFEGRSWK